jgi:hypothetical protein
MVTYEQAKKTALQVDKKFNQAFDYGDAFLFNIKGDMSTGHSNVVVLKKSGKLVDFAEYLHLRTTNASPTNIPF